MMCVLKKSVLLQVLVVFLIGSLSTLACRIIEPIPRPVRPIPEPVKKQPLETKSHDAKVVIHGQVAEVHLTALFHNPNSFRMEGTYWFPLPREAAVKSFKMRINGKNVKAELLDSDKARDIYEGIVRRMKDPALLEWAGSQMLKCRIFPIAPNGETRVELKYTQLLEQESGLVRFSYPLRSAKNKAGNIGNLVMDVSIEAEHNLHALHSPTHAFDVLRKGNQSARMTMEKKNASAKENVEIVFSTDTGKIGMSVLTHGGKQEDGYFMLTAAPQYKIEKANVLPKDIVFVCDTSGSMLNDDKIKQVKKALRFCVKNLADDDRFTILGFSSVVRPFSKSLKKASEENVDDALRYIEDMEALGGTAIHQALTHSMDLFQEDAQLPMVVFLTDGLPTIGTRDVNKIIQDVSKKNTVGARLFVFGVGYDVNTKLLDLLAENNSGTRSYVKPEENLEHAISSFYRKVSSPVLQDVSLSFSGIQVYDYLPAELPDMFGGSQLVILGRYKGVGDATVLLQGKANGEKQRFETKAHFHAKPNADYLPRLWALRKVAFLLDEIRLHGSSSELVDEIVALGKEHGIVTPYTSFLVTEDKAEPGRENAMEEEEVRSSLDEAPEPVSVPETPVGRGAVEQGMRLQKRKEVDSVADFANAEVTSFSYDEDRSERDGKGRKAMSTTLRVVGDYVFKKRLDGVWIENELLNRKAFHSPKKIQRFDKTFFNLIEQYPQLGKIAAEIPETFLIEIDGTVYKVE